MIVPSIRIELDERGFIIVRPYVGRTLHPHHSMRE